jgi:hypothetical protein
MANDHAPTKRPAEASPVGIHQCPVVSLANFASYNYNEVITILVGPEEHRFIAHKDVICDKSKFFKAACSDRWLEVQEKIVRLPGARSEVTFRTYIDWIYRSDLVVDEVESEDSEEVDLNTKSELIELYLLGDVLEDVKLRNKIIHLLNTNINTSDHHLDPHLCELIWDNTTSNSLLRKWTVDSIITNMNSSGFESSSSLWPADLVLQIAIRFMKLHGHGVPDLEGLEERLRDYTEVDDDA